MAIFRASMLFFGLFFGLISGLNAFAGAPNPCKKTLDPSCQQICQTCADAGYIVGQAKNGDGFWMDCVRPIITSTPEPAKAASTGHTLPVVDGGLIAKCKAADPGFGMGKAPATPH